MKPESVAIRPAEQGDARPLAALCGQLGYPATREQVGQRLAQIRHDECHAVFVAQLPDGPLVGWVHAATRTMLLSEPHVEIEGLVVDAAYRRCGIGRRLMQRVEQWAGEKGCCWVYLRSNVVREDAHCFYAELGYRCIKTQLALLKEL